MHKTHQELLRIARERIAELCDRHHITRPAVELDLRGCSAGRAILKENRIRLNPALFAENFEDFLEQTIPHELCHLWHYQRGLRGRAHGREWQLLMLSMGVRPERTHCYDVTNARVRRKTKRARYEYACGCRTAHQVSAVVHNRMSGGCVYRCRVCRQALSLISSSPVVPP